jgi:hypothetical protein
MHQTDSDNPFVRILDTQRLKATQRIEVSVAHGDMFLHKAFDGITATHPASVKAMVAAREPASARSCPMILAPGMARIAANTRLAWT